MLPYYAIVALIFVVRSDESDYNGRDCKWEAKDEYICTQEPSIHYKLLDKCLPREHKTKRISVFERKHPKQRRAAPKPWGFGPYLPPCPQPYPLCPPSYIAPRPQWGPSVLPCTPPCPPPYPWRPKFNFVAAIERLTLDRQNELSTYFTNRAKIFSDTVRQGILLISVNLVRQITQQNTALINTLSSILLPQQSQLLQNLSTQINATNNAILSGLNSLVSTGNVQVEANIVALAALAAAAIEASIINLTTSTGTLQQILAITQGITNGFNTLVATQTQEQLTNVNTLLANESTALQTPIAAAITATDAAVQQLSASASSQAGALIVGIFKKFLGESTIFVESLLKEYGLEVDRLVIAYFN